MTPHAAFLRGVNLGKRTVKSAELKAAFEAMGFGTVKTLLASGNVLFDAHGDGDLRQTIEAGLKARLGFPVGVVLRRLETLQEMVASDPFRGRVESEEAKLHVLLFEGRVPKGLAPEGIPGDFEVAHVGAGEIFLVVFRKPDGTYLGRSQFALDKERAKGSLVTMRNWNTILKAVA